MCEGKKQTCFTTDGADQAAMNPIRIDFCSCHCGHLNVIIDLLLNAMMHLIVKDILTFFMEHKHTPLF